MSSSVTTSEREHLEVHVDNCEQRYRALEQRIAKIESKLDKIDEKLHGFRLDFFKIMVGTASSIIVAIIGAITVIKWG